MSAAPKINKDLKEEREKVTFEIEEFTKWYHGGVKELQEKRFLENYFLSDPDLIQGDVDPSYLSHKEKYEEAIRRVVVILRRIEKLKSEGHNIDNIHNKIFGSMIISNVFKEGSPLVTHIGMFGQALASLGTPEQHSEWLERALNCRIWGSYVQTELGHGTFVRGLETTATYDPTTKEFVINSPTTSSYKWWPGGLGHTVNHVVVFAQLYSLGKHHGIQPFIVQVREFETHKPMKGIIIGEIGNKVGFNSVNNGFLAFQSVRIPLKNMLMRNARVSENGEFVKSSQSAVLNYGVMTLVRVDIVKGMGDQLSKAVTIAMRYSTVRRQSPIDPSLPEPKIIEHVTQQMKLFPAIVKVVAIKCAANSLIQLFSDVTAEVERGDLTRLPELHSLSCCLKVLTTDEVAQSVQICRLACGGHGFLNSSGFNDIYGHVAAAQHYEGENTVLLLQTARYLTKAWSLTLQGQKLVPSVEYLANYVNTSGRLEKWEGSPSGILKAFQAATAGQLSLAYKHLEQRKKTLSPELATSQTAIELAKVSQLHCQVFLLQSIILSVRKMTRYISKPLAAVFQDILELYAYDLALRYLGSLLQFVSISSTEMEKLQLDFEVSLKKFRNNAIGIVDGFDIPDSILGSTLGAYDGNVYERMLNAAKKSPLNQEDVNKSFHLYLKPFIKSNL
ncbi:probable peroxisomal acyl-coenzyme A oxidase 1 [Bradysia coprophila]|uniref:probable peroxisomal acyl-coenzyme A oxidase 1 n=1 Tax=Bradysia coprophila TaxID=38358 RepID=UPI00187DC42C|nr:probable peroxisomal acyl-coenzyme A oxidase 1 [Bradysia coprophila]XP_037030301.1 probable peroxisomal acyl-coenzyme A oxidase 1 [Bradysia coprophila]